MLIQSLEDNSSAQALQACCVRIQSFPAQIIEAGCSFWPDVCAASVDCVLISSSISQELTMAKSSLNPSHQLLGRCLIS